MTIQIKISELLGKNKMTQKELSEKTGIRAATVSALYHEQIKRIDIEHINKLCEVFNCLPGEIFEYIPDDLGSNDDLATPRDFEKNDTMMLEDSPHGMIVKRKIVKKPEDHFTSQDIDLIKNYVEEILLEILQKKYNEKK